MNHHRGASVTSLLLGVLLPLAMPLVVGAHSELVSAIPADGSTVTGTPEEIVLTFDADLNPDKSSIVLVDSAGTQLITAGVDPDDKRVMRLTPPSVQPGEYEVDWTSVATDGDLLRGKVHFTIIAPTGPPSVAPSETAAASSAASPSASAEPAATPTPAASSAPSPAGSSGADVILPVVAAIVLIAVLGAILLRGRRSGGTR